MTARRIASALAIVLAGALASAPGAAADLPFKGDASWIWYVSESGGSGAAIGREADRRGLDAVYVKSADGTSTWSQFSSSLVDEIHDRGVDVCGWQYVYGADTKAEAMAGEGCRGVCVCGWGRRLPDHRCRGRVRGAIRRRREVRAGAA